MNSVRIPRGLTTGIASGCNKKEFITLDTMRSLPQGRSMKKFGIILFILAAVPLISLVTPWTGKNPLTGVGIVHAQEDWKAEFENVCSKTQDAMTLNVDELKDLIARCDKLKPAIEKLDESPRKVYLKRLQLCKDLFVFVLGSKEKK